MFRLVPTACILGALTLAGCTGASEDSQPDTPTSIAAYPDLPHFEGDLAVTLVPALREVSDGRCTPDDDHGCSPDGTESFRMLGERASATVVEALTAPSTDHTSWTTTVRFDGSTQRAVEAARDSAAGLGGVVLVMARNADDQQVLAVANPQEIQGKRADFLGLEKAEAWAIVDAFGAV
ncbi:hypothetical protein ABLE68_07580 [Nocardioides sp. CN2-186]|uniref:hypothetical protein n=1 Tax=Nocardioides tweenelious TaxID=3156607 RepID=UPI0032B586C1